MMAHIQDVLPSFFSDTWNKGENKRFLEQSDVETAVNQTKGALRDIYFQGFVDSYLSTAYEE